MVSKHTSRQFTLDFAWISALVHRSKTFKQVPSPSAGKIDTKSTATTTTGPRFSRRIK
jgi:hypothetical protein